MQFLQQDQNYKRLVKLLVTLKQKENIWTLLDGKNFVDNFKLSDPQDKVLNDLKSVLSNITKADFEKKGWKDDTID